MKKKWIALLFLVGTGSTQLIHAADPYLPTNYDEPYRGQYHFSQQSGWMNDINGVWFDNGVYNLTCQAWPYSLNGDAKSWGHATSTDMMHWTQQPNAFDPGVNAPGDCWSGSAVVDVNNTSGFGTLQNPPIVAIYTATSKGTCLMYSLDKGMTWVAYANNPVNVGGPNGDTRDPRVLWHAPTGKWVCVLYENGTTFYTSTDLKTWTKVSNINWGYECPDFFELAVDGGATKKWVLMEADSKYFVGTFDGTTFTRDAGGPYVMVNNSGIGGGFYASQTFFSTNFPGGRTVQMGWMSGLGPGSTAPWTHNSTFPCEVKLQTYTEGVRTSRNPITEISSLYGTTQNWESQTLRSGQNLFAGKLSKCFDVEAVFDVTDATASAIIFTFANKSVTYDLQNKTLFGSSLKPINNQVKIRFLVDWGELEAFGNDGQYSYAENFKFTPSDHSVSMTANGNVKLVSARFSTINRTWPGTPCNAYMDDADPKTICTGNWHPFSGESGYYNSTGRWSNVVGDKIEYTFTGTQISWYGLKNDDLGFADVYIDGALVTENIDCYSKIRISQQLFTKTGLSNGNHTIKVVLKGLKNPASSNINLVHDYFATVESPSSPTAMDDASASMKYTGNWVTDVNAMYYKSTCHVSNTENAYVEATFTGKQVFWYGLKNDDLGMAAVYIDGQLAADNIDCYSTTKAVHILFSKTNLTNDTHTIKVVVKGTKNAVSKGTALVHDYFDFPAMSATIVDDASKSTIYNGNWVAPTNEDGYYNRNCHVGLAANAYCKLTFTGTQIAWYGLRNDDLGFASVFIDDVLVADDIDCYSTNRGVIRLFNKTGLTDGTHTIKVVLKGTKNPASKGIALVHDYFSMEAAYSPALAIRGDFAFGNVLQNTTATKTLTISNTNNVPLAVSSIELPAGFSANWTSGDIAIDAKKEVIVTFAPIEEKTYSGMIRVNTNAGIDSLAVTGTGTNATSVGKTTGMSLYLSPNPVKNILTIVAKDVCNLILTDISGKELTGKKMLDTTTELNMTAYPKGVYILKAINTKGEQWIQKVVKN